MFGELLSHSEEIIFLEAIDQYFELNSNSDIQFKDSFKEESNENIESINIYDLLNEENILSNKKSEENASKNNLMIPRKYILMNECINININKKFIDELKANIYNDYKSQIERIEYSPFFINNS